MFMAWMEEAFVANKTLEPPKLQNDKLACTGFQSRLLIYVKGLKDSWLPKIILKRIICKMQIFIILQYHQILENNSQGWSSEEYSVQHTCPKQQVWELSSINKPFTGNHSHGS